MKEVFQLDIRHLVWSISILFFLSSCQSEHGEGQQDQTVVHDTRIVSLNGTLSEIVVAVGKGDKMVGVDVTTTYPASLSQLPRLGHSRTLSVEGVLGLSPTHILGLEKELSPEVVEQLKAGGAKVILYEQDYSSEGTSALIRQVGRDIGAEETGKEQANVLESRMSNAPTLAVPHRILFVYARGAGSVMVGGIGTAAHAMIETTGGINAGAHVEGFKPLTDEAVLLAHPDVILLFDTGLESLEGPEGLLSLPGVAATPAGQHRRFVTMDGQLLLGFGPRLPEAKEELVVKVSAAFE